MPRKFRLSVPKKRRKCDDYSGAQHIVSTSSLPVSIPISLLSDELTLTVSLPLVALPSSKFNLVVSLPRTVAAPVLESTLTISLPLSVYLNAPVESLQSLEERMKLSNILPSNWGTFSPNGTHVTVFKALCAQTTSFETSIDINSALEWRISTRQKELRIMPATLLEVQPFITSLSTLRTLITYLESAVVCEGNPDERFMSLASSRKGTFCGLSGDIKAFLDSSGHSPTIRTTTCELLTSSEKHARCNACSSYRKVLSAMLHRAESQQRDPDKCNPSSTTNYRYLNTPEKLERMKRLHADVKVSQQRARRLEKRIEDLTEKHGVTVDPDLHSEIADIATESASAIMERYPENSFERIFWQQQLKRSRLRDSRSMKWHPLMIRWCIYLRHLSGKAYETMRQSGAIHLPSQRTLRDYTYYTEAKPGFSVTVDNQLSEMANIRSCSEREKHVILLMDEMHIRDDIVYDKHTGAISGFVNLGEIQSHLAAFEHSLDDEAAIVPSVANSMLVVLVRGLFSTLNFPYAQFPCRSLRGDQMYSPFWESVSRLERCGFKVMGLTCDGLSANRLLFKLHVPGEKLVHSVLNPYASPSRQLYFFSDPPHLVKTVRNAWANGKRKLEINEKKIAWDQLVKVYKQDRGGSSTNAPGLALMWKVKFEHIYLTSYSKMRVDLAAQVLSLSVANALEQYGGEEASETVRFIALFNNFFDAVNVSRVNEGKLSRNCFKSAYWSGTDWRLKWLVDDFLGYLDEWETCVASKSGLSALDQKMRMLPAETLTGLRLTVHSFVDLVKYLFKVPGVKFFLSNRLCQDPIENFFGQQRQRGGIHDNPNVPEFLKNTQALRVVNGLCRGVGRGNCRGAEKRKRSADVNINNSKPLPKRKCKHK